MRVRDEKRYRRFRVGSDDLTRDQIREALDEHPNMRRYVASFAKRAAPVADVQVVLELNDSRPASTVAGMFPGVVKVEHLRAPDGKRPQFAEFVFAATLGVDLENDVIGSPGYDWVSDTLQLMALVEAKAKAG